jgi:DNA-binding transcriptional LysR family regulator
MRVDVLAELPPDLAEQAWEFYHETFAPLVTRAATRHLMNRGEFDAMMADGRVFKFVTRDGDGLTGLSVMSDDLDAVPLISPPYFRHHWPDLYAQRRIVYCVFIGARPGPRGDGVFVALQREVYLTMVRPVDGVVVLDTCLWNERERKLPWKVEGIASAISGGEARATRVDSQSYWLYEFPAAS